MSDGGIDKRRYCPHGWPSRCPHDGCLGVSAAGDDMSESANLLPRDFLSNQMLASGLRVEQRQNLVNESTIRRLLIALHDAIRSPMGVVPDSAVEFCSELLARAARWKRYQTDKSEPRAGQTHPGWNLDKWKDARNP